MAKGLGTTLTKIPTSSITDSTIGITNLVTSGTASSSTFLKGDYSWGAVSVSGKINVVDSDPAIDTAGDIWYADSRFKFVSDPSALGAVWVSGGNLGTAKKGGAGAGNLDAGLYVGGGNAGGNVKTTELYDGSSWRTSGNVTNDRNQSISAGTQSAALVAAGPGPTDTTEEFNGTAWSAAADLPDPRQWGSWCGGTQTSCYGSGGALGSTTTATTIEYDGTCWSNSNSMPAARSSGPGHGVGKVSAGLAYEGYLGGPYFNNTYEYDGTCWSTANDGIYARGQTSGAGSQGAAVAAGGYFSSSKAWSSETSEYDGTCWSVANTLVTATYATGGGGSISAAFITGGEKGSNVYANETQEYRRAVMKFIGT